MRIGVSPYLFLKASKGAVVGNGDPIVIPYGRDRTDWEVELGTVIGRTAKYVSANDAQDYVFGYVVTLDISDRGGRPPGGNPLRSDWFVGKGHDTFAPMGPWIVPKEFYGDPMENLRQTLSVGDTKMQEGDRRRYDPLSMGVDRVRLVHHYAFPWPTSSIMGRPAAPVWALRSAALNASCSRAKKLWRPSMGSGTLRMPVVAEDAPTGLTGAQLAASQEL